VEPKKENLPGARSPLNFEINEPQNYGMQGLQAIRERSRTVPLNLNLAHQQREQQQNHHQQQNHNESQNSQSSSIFQKIDQNDFNDRLRRTKEPTKGRRMVAAFPTEGNVGMALEENLKKNKQFSSKSAKTKNSKYHSTPAPSEIRYSTQNNQNNFGATMNGTNQDDTLMEIDKNDIDDHENLQEIEDIINERSPGEKSPEIAPATNLNLTNQTNSTTRSARSVENIIEKHKARKSKTQPQIAQKPQKVYRKDLQKVADQDRGQVQHQNAQSKDKNLVNQAAENNFLNKSNMPWIVSSIVEMGSHLTPNWRKPVLEKRKSMAYFDRTVPEMEKSNLLQGNRGSGDLAHLEAASNSERGSNVGSSISVQKHLEFNERNSLNINTDPGFSSCDDSMSQVGDHRDNTILRNTINMNKSHQSRLSNTSRTRARDRNTSTKEKTRPVGMFVNIFHHFLNIFTTLLMLSFVILLIYTAFKSNFNKILGSFDFNFVGKEEPKEIVVQPEPNLSKMENFEFDQEKFSKIIRDDFEKRLLENSREVSEMIRRSFEEEISELRVGVGFF